VGVELQLDLNVRGPQWEGIFDSLEVWRSRDKDTGPYEALTSDTWARARIPRGSPEAPITPVSGPSANVNGLELLLRVNEETDITVTFATANPLTYGQAAGEITAQGQGLVRSYVVGNILVVETLEVGNGALLRVVGGDAAPLLGLPTAEPLSFAFGREARSQLVVGKETYPFVDKHGDESYFYKTRFYNARTNTAGAFGLPFNSKSAASLSASSLVVATVDLVDSRGVALANRAVLLRPQFRGVPVDGKTVVDGDIQRLTDSDGHVEFVLVRGQVFTVAIAGTDVVRDFTAPTDASVTSFNMLDPSLSSDDVFNVQKPDLRFAARRSI